MTALIVVLVRLRNMVKEDWSGIEVQLKRRVNLIQTVRGYLDHERGVCWRSSPSCAARPCKRTNPPSARLEGDLDRAIGRLFAVESFPSNIVAGVSGFRQAEFFGNEDAADRAAPKVGF
ncbi:MAG: hypothetical protein JRJ72_10915 [Deltaproteobacteria bacterium]|nr:hypothetical protein [Deltaproteobacteria bacterium]